MKYLQNRIAESGTTLPVAIAFSLVVWLLSGLVQQQLWPQLVCFVVSIYVMVELTNQNALLRVRSRMVSTTFIVLSCCACFLLPQLTGGVVQLCLAVAFLMMFHTYQAPDAVGRTFFAFAFVGLASLAFVQIMWYVPVLWILMFTQLQSLCWRTWLSSLLGLALPYWLTLLWLLLPFNLSEEWTADLSLLADHFMQLADIDFHLTFTSFPLPFFTFLFTVVLTAAAIAHFWQYSFEDKIRIRMLYGFFTTMSAVTLTFILLQPQHFGVLMRVFILCTSPLIAHVLTFTATRFTNIVFFVVLVIAVALTFLNLLFPAV